MGGPASRRCTALHVCAARRWWLVPPRQANILLWQGSTFSPHSVTALCVYLELACRVCTYLFNGFIQAL